MILCAFVFAFCVYVYHVFQFVFSEMRTRARLSFTGRVCVSLSLSPLGSKFVRALHTVVSSSFDVETSINICWRREMMEQAGGCGRHCLLVLPRAISLDTSLHPFVFAILVAHDYHVSLYTKPVCPTQDKQEKPEKNKIKKTRKQQRKKEQNVAETRLSFSSLSTALIVPRPSSQ